MPNAAASRAPTPQDVGRAVDDLGMEAVRFVALDRCAAQSRKWLPREIDAMPEHRQVSTAADAVLLATDLQLSQPSASGATAFDRLARSRPHATPAEAAALVALRAARFRLLRVEASPQVTDVLSNETLSLVGSKLPPVARGMLLFARAATLGDGLCCLPSAATPLDAAAAEVARAHPQARTGGARWAEAVYAHVVRHGTLEVPGLNRPSGDFDDDDFDDEGGGELFVLALAWKEAGDGMPDESIVRRTRALADDMATILDSLTCAVLSHGAGDAAMAGALERILLVQLETVSRRAQIGSGALSLDVVRKAVEQAVAAGRLPPKARKLLTDVERRLGGRAARADDPEMDRLIQKIRGLRAKTVDQGCTEQEAIAAAEKVAELLDRYGLSLGELDFKAQPCEGIGIQTERRRLGPIDACVASVAGFFDCRVWLENAKGQPLRYVFFGLRGDVTAAEFLYAMVERAFEAETKRFRAGPLYMHLAGERRSATHSFQTGLAQGIIDKLGALRKARNAKTRSDSGRDLVPIKAAIVDDEMAKLGLTMETRRVGRGTRVITDAFDAGAEAGARFEPTAALTRAA